MQIILYDIICQVQISDLIKILKKRFIVNALQKCAIKFKSIILEFRKGLNDIVVVRIWAESRHTKKESNLVKNGVSRGMKNVSLQPNGGGAKNNDVISDFF